MASLPISLRGEPHALLLNGSTILIQPPTNVLSNESTPVEIPLSYVAFLRTKPSPNEAISVDLIYVEGLYTLSTLPSVRSASFLAHRADFTTWTERHPPLLALLLDESQAMHPRRVELVVNSSAGGGRAREFALEVVGPLLEWAGVTSRLSETSGVDDAGRIARELLLDSKREEGMEVVLAVLGGDGTTHEVLNGVLDPASSAKVVGPPNPLELILLPLGTANAYYHHLFAPESSSFPSSTPLSALYSLLAFLRSRTPSSTPPPALKPLSVALNRLPPPHRPQVFTFVVSSAALHASILYDAEALRATIPTVDRFKVAAQQNATNWCKGRLTLLPSLEDSSKGAVGRYDSASKSLVPVSNGSTDLTLTLDGPFSYLASSLISRFESKFLVAPLRSPSSPLAPSLSPPTLDIILVRPLRDPSTRALFELGKEKEAKKGFVSKLRTVFAGMYNGGVHIDEKVELGEAGIVEYFRCGGFVWTPEESDEVKSRLVCLDGAVYDLGNGGSLDTRAIDSEETGIKVWC